MIDMLKNNRELLPVFCEMKARVLETTGFKVLDVVHSESEIGIVLEETESAICSIHNVSVDKNLLSQCNKIFNELREKYIFEPETASFKIRLYRFDLAIAYYLMEISMPKIKNFLIENYKDNKIFDVTSSGNEVIVIFYDEPGESNIDNKRIIANGLRERIGSDCLRILKENDELNLYKWNKIGVKFSDKEILERRFEGNLVKLAYSDWEHGSGLY